MPDSQTLSDLMSVGLWMNQHQGVPGVTPYDRNIPGLPPPGYVWTGDHWESPAQSESSLNLTRTDPFGGFSATVQSPTGPYTYGRVVQPNEILADKRMAMYSVARDPHSILGEWLTPEEKQQAISGDWKFYAAGLTPWEMFQAGILKKDPTAGLPHEASLSGPVDNSSYSKALKELQERGIELPGFAENVAHVTGAGKAAQTTPASQTASTTSAAVQNLINVSNQLWNSSGLPKVTTTPGTSPTRAGIATGSLNLPGISNATMDIWDFRQPKAQTAAPTGNFGYNWSNLF